MKSFVQNALHYTSAFLSGISCYLPGPGNILHCPNPPTNQGLLSQLPIIAKACLCRAIRALRFETISGGRIPKSWRASSSCCLVAPIKEFSRNAGRPPTPSRKIYRGTRTRPKICEREETRKIQFSLQQALSRADTPAEQVLRLHTSVTPNGPNRLQAKAPKACCILL